MVTDNDRQILANYTLDEVERAWRNLRASPIDSDHTKDFHGAELINLLDNARQGLEDESFDHSN